MTEAAMDLDKRLNNVDYGYFNTVYVPSVFAHQFIGFIKMVNGSMGEENKSPIIHYDMLDQIVANPGKKSHQNLFVSFRGSAKTTALHEYMYLYLAVYGSVPGFGGVNVAMYISDTMDNGVKSMRNNLEFRWNNSDFLQKYVPETKFTDVRWEFKNLEGKKFVTRGFGATTGVRGFKEYGERPTWCHAVGTDIQVGDWKGVVEEYPNRSDLRIETGIQVALEGLPQIENVTKEHMYHGKHLTVKRHKKYLANGTTKSTSTCQWSEDGWIHAEDLTKFSYIGSPIDYTEEELPDNHVWFSDNEFWWAYGLWLGDGSLSEGFVQWYIADTENHTVGLKLEQFLLRTGKTYSIQQRKGCYQVRIRDRKLHRLLKKQKQGNSCKLIPEEWMRLPIDTQKQILYGYIAADGFEDYKNNQIRCNSVYLPMLKQFGTIAERLGLPYHIRKTKKAGTQIFPNGQLCETQEQHEIRFRENVKEVLGFNVENQTSRGYSHVLIEDGFIWRKVRALSEVKDTFVPIHTPDHTYLTDFGLSHNCGFDDLMSDKNAESATITADIKKIVYKAARQAMHPKKRMQLWTGTPFNKSDPLYEAAGSKSWNTRVYPICEKFPVPRSEFRGAWEDRFDYDFVKNEYESLLESGEIGSFNQELMLRIASDEDRLVQDHEIVWYKRDSILKNRSRYNFYITTDFATSEKKKSDFSVICVWAYTNNGEWLLVDGICKRQLMDANINQLFKFVSIYRPLSVGIEINGQQGGFIQWIKGQMIDKNIFFNLAGKGTVEGIRRTGAKITQFKLFVPSIKAKKVWFPEEMRDSPLVVEAMEELRFATEDGFKSKHDDVSDAMSMLLELDPFKPSEESTPEFVDDEDGTHAFFNDEPDEDIFRNSTVF